MTFVGPPFCFILEFIVVEHCERIKLRLVQVNVVIFDECQSYWEPFLWSVGLQILVSIRLNSDSLSRAPPSLEHSISFL